MGISPPVSGACPLKTCRVCGHEKPDTAFLAGKAKRISSSCGDCRKRAARRHAQDYYRRMPSDQRHTLTHKRRAEALGAAHEPYLRSEVFARWGWACCYCGARAGHLDHVVALKLGGADAAHNIVPACADCNLRKGALSLADWALRP